LLSGFRLLFSILFYTFTFFFFCSLPCLLSIFPSFHVSLVVCSYCSTIVYSDINNAMHVWLSELYADPVSLNTLQALASTSPQQLEQGWQSVSVFCACARLFSPSELVVHLSVLLFRFFFFSIGLILNSRSRI
jgi:Sec-independent protein secretion pathway component TatC